MDKQKLMESYKKGYLLIRDIPTVEVQHDIKVTCYNRDYNIKKGWHCLDCNLDVLGKWMYMEDMMDSAIKKNIVTIGEVIELIENTEDEIKNTHRKPQN